MAPGPPHGPLAPPVDARTTMQSSPSRSTEPLLHQPPLPKPPPRAKPHRPEASTRSPSRWKTVLIRPCLPPPHPWPALTASAGATSVSCRQVSDPRMALQLETANDRSHAGVGRSWWCGRSPTMGPGSAEEPSATADPLSPRRPIEPESREAGIHQRGTKTTSDSRIAAAMAELFGSHRQPVLKDASKPTDVTSALQCSARRILPERKNL